VAYETLITVRLGHTDAARRLYFARQLDLVHEAFEDWLAAEGLPIRTLVDDPTGGLPIVHAEADYTGQVFTGDPLTVRLTVAKRSSRSFTLAYALSVDGREVGRASTVHVAVDGSTGRSRDLPDALIAILDRHRT
jgi:1,4-dihydroxy-2-naphthoyl-CoA hydrolase